MVNKYKEESEIGIKAKKHLRQVENKNKALLLYINHIQLEIDKAQKYEI